MTLLLSQLSNYLLYGSFKRGDEHIKEMYFLNLSSNFDENTQQLRSNIKNIYLITIYVAHVQKIHAYFWSVSVKQNCKYFQENIGFSKRHWWDSCIKVHNNWYNG